MAHKLQLQFILNNCLRIVEVLDAYPQEHDLLLILAMNYMAAAHYRQPEIAPQTIGYWPQKSEMVWVSHSDIDDELCHPVGYPVADSTQLAPEEHARVCDRFFRLIKLFNFEICNYLGHSACRLCDRDQNGCGEYKFGKYIIPTGYEHYLRDHSVAPDPLVFEIVDKYGCLLDLPAEILQTVQNMIDAREHLYPYSKNIHMLQIMAGMGGLKYSQ